jgi:Tfp pilus assembly protein PilX
MIKDRVNRVTKAQALIVVLLLMFIAGLLGLGLSKMWGTDSATRSVDEDGLVAFYLAEAGLERAKAAINTSWAWTDTSMRNLGAGQYNITITNVGGNKEVISSGWVPSAAAPRAVRRVRVRLNLTAVPPPPVNVVPNSWREL